MEEGYSLTMQDFTDKAEKTLQLSEKMSQAFGSKELDLTQRQKEYLKICISAACLDSHYNGYKNGTHK